MTVTGLSLALVLCMLYDFFPCLTPGLRGYAYYWQRLTVITVSLIRTLSSQRWCWRTFQRKTLPSDSSHGVQSKKYCRWRYYYYRWHNRIVCVIILQVSSRPCHWLRVVENAMIWLSGTNLRSVEYNSPFHYMWPDLKKGPLCTIFECIDFKAAYLCILYAI